MLQNGANQRFELQAKSHPPVHAALWQQASEYIIFERGFLMHQVTNVINEQGEKERMFLFSIITISSTRTRIRSYNTIDPTLNEHQKYS